MTFDKPEHKEIVKQLLEQANYPGKLVELAVEVKKAVAEANVATDERPA